MKKNIFYEKNKNIFTTTIYFIKILVLIFYIKKLLYKKIIIYNNKT